MLLVYSFWVRRGDLFSAFRAFLKNPKFVGLTLVFLTYFLSGINSEDNVQWLKQIRIKLPFILLPLAFSFIGPLNRKESKLLHYGLALTCFISAIPVILNYIQNSSDMITAIGKGQYIPTPIDHIHYSIIMAYSALALIIISLNERFALDKKEKVFAFSLSLLIILLIHVFAVRSGIAILYLGFFFILCWKVIFYKKYILGFVGLASLISLPFLAYNSDSERIMSYVIAIDLAKEKPFLGHGVGDLKQLMTDKHKSKYGIKEKYIFPHNQYLYVLSGIGLIGFIFFFYGLLSPMIYGNKSPLLVLIFLVMLASFMVENTVQRAVSIAFFLLFILWNSNIENTDRNHSVKHSNLG